MSGLKKIATSTALKKLLKLLPQESPREKIDAYRASLALKCYTVCNKSSAGVPSPEDVDKFMQEVDSMSHPQRAKYVHEGVNDQIISMFTALERHDLSLASHKKMGRDPAGLRADVGFTLDIRHSNIPGAGEGLFLRTENARSLPPGTVLALYPGLVHLKEHLKKIEHFQSLLPDDDFLLMARLDESIIDGRTADRVVQNQYALAHKINHSGEQKPNVMQLAYDYPEDFFLGRGFPPELRRYIPNKYAIPPSLLGMLEVGSVCMKGIVMIAARHMEDGDEVLMDYKLDPNSASIPPWYSFFDVEDSRARWEDDE